MNKNWNGYMTVEASFLMPMVLFLYLLIILCGFFLYNRCIISQDNYLLAFRGSRFTEASDNYGEVIYGDMDKKEVDETYIRERMAYKAGLGPFYTPEQERVLRQGDMTVVASAGYGGTLTIVKRAEKLNILEIIRTTRR
ncbi:MAG: pilus assembly protein [Lachnospiraceae bacterium]|jgi:hypothetical protein|nr:pilus assembly protein [Lachnospiraceae bacterium]MDE6816680.1 pilus assembly protein [Lachnospiraceae bacterium]MDE6977516.1 pilus assembly protein [Lachnospiraceae bacterium]